MTRAGVTPLLIALGAAEIAAAFESSMMHAALAKMTLIFADTASVGWLVTGFLLVGAAAAAIAGRLGDIYGRRDVMVVLMAVAAAGSLLSALSTNYYLIFVGRALQGLSATVLPLSVGLIRENLSPARVPMGIGLLVSTGALGTALGLIIGGVIVDRAGWQSIFVAAAVLGFVAAVMVVALVPRSPRNAPEGGIDLIGGVLFAPAIGAILLALSQGPKWGWTTAATIGCLVGGIVLLALWIRHSLRTPNPMIDVRLFARRGVVLGNVMIALLAVGPLQLSLLGSLLVQAPRWTGFGLGLSATAAGALLLPSLIAATISAAIAGWMAARFGGRSAIAIGAIIAGAGWALAMTLPDSALVLGLLLCAMAFGSSAVYTAVPSVIIAAVPEARTSEAIGMMSVARATGMAIGSQIIVQLLATSSVTQPGGSAQYPAASAFELALGFMAVAAFSIALVTMLLRRETESVDRPFDELGATPLAAGAIGQNDRR